MSHLHSRIGHETPLRTAETSLHQPLRLPSVFTVNHDLDGATVRRWLRLDRPLHGDRHSAVGVEQALVGRVPRIDTDEDGLVSLVGDRQLEREVGPGSPQRFPAHALR